MEILGLDIHAWITITLVIGMFATMLLTKISAEVVFFGVMAILIITGCVPAETALGGFSSETVAVIGVLFVVVAGLEATGVLHWVVQNLLGRPKSYWKAIVRLMLPVALLSAILSNTTVVALFINVVKMWAKKLKTAPSKLLIPLSYAAGMGGLCTLIGTPPNLIISGFYSDVTNEQMSIFITTLPGLFCLVVGIAAIIIMQRLLPSHRTPNDEIHNSLQKTVSYLYIATDKSKLPGQTIGEANILNDLTDSRLIGVVHFDGEMEHIDTMKPEEAEKVFLMGSDTLIFTGNRDEVKSLARKHHLIYDGNEELNTVKTGFPTILSSLIMIAMVVLSATNVLPLLDSCLIAAGLMLLTRCCSIKQAKQAINWDVLLIFACSITLGKAIDSTGLAQLLADSLATICGSNALIALIIICFLGTFLTEFISNTACGAIMAPVAIKIAMALGANPITFCVALMISVSSSFATPIGSPTHLMVYVPGGYRFNDFIRIGLPMNFIILAANIIICLLLFPL